MSSSGCVEYRNDIEQYIAECDVEELDGARHQLINHHDFVVAKSNESLNVNKL